MSKLKPNTEAYNRAANKIADINLTIDIFLKKFELFRKEFDVTDENLNKRLQNIIDVIDNFIDNEPEDINSHEKSEINIDLDKHTIKNVYVCSSCDEEVGNRFKDIQKHITTSHHEINTSTELPPQKITVNSKTLPSNNLQQKIQPINNLQQNNNKKLPRVEKRKLKKEMGKTERSAKKQDGGVELENLPKKTKLLLSENFEKFLIDRYEYGNKLKMVPNYENVARSLLAAISDVYPDARYHFFGSRISGLGTIHSDLDIFLNIGNVFNLYNESPSKIVAKLHKVHELLTKRPDEWKSFVKVTTARVPVLKVYNKQQCIDCDIAFSNGLGPCNTLLMKYFYELQPLCHKMCLYVKEWLLLTTLKVNFTTYTLALMVVFYLQTKNILPSVDVLQAQIEVPVMIGPWQGNFVEKQLRELEIRRYDDSYESVKFYLRSFFEYYTSFDFAKYVVCPYLGQPIEKEIFNTNVNPMQRYYNYFILNKDQNSFQIDKIMCVQDPLEQNHNVSKSISEGLLKRLRHYFALTARELKIK